MKKPRACQDMRLGSRLRWGAIKSESKMAIRWQQIEMVAPPSTAAQAMMIHTLEPMDPVSAGGNG